MSTSPRDIDLDELIATYRERYAETTGILPETLEQIGEQYREQGHLNREQLHEIAYASSTRSAYHVKNNPADRCQTVTANVRRVADDFSKVQLLTGLKGLQTPTASVVLTALEPTEHAVVDTRVWASLERLGYLAERKERFKPTDYGRMLEPIREIATTVDHTPATVGYALFAYDVAQRDGTLH